MEKETRNSIILFLILSFVPMWVFSYIYYIMKSDTILLVMMLLPAVASVITRVVRNEGFERMLLRPHLRRNLKWYFTAYFAPPFIACFGAAVYFLIFGSDFSPLQSAFAICKVINPDYKEVSKETLKGKTNDYKSCKTSTGVYFPFGDTPEVDAFNDRVKNHYSEALNSMVAFVEQFIDSDSFPHPILPKPFYGDFCR